MSLLSDAVAGIGIALIEDQMDIADYMPEFLEDKCGHDPEAIDELDWHEVLLRAIVVNAKVAARELADDYGIEDGTLYPVEN